MDINSARHQLVAHGTRSSSLPSFHHARNASSCISCALVNTRLASGGAVSNNICRSQVRSSVVESQMTMASSPWNGCGKWRTRLKGLITFKRRILCASSSLLNYEQAHSFILAVCPTHVLFLPETQKTCFMGMV